MQSDGAGEFAGEGARVRGIVEPHVMHAHAFAFQLFREVAHGREDQDDLLFMMRNISRLLRHLRHEDHVLGGIQPVKRAQGARELIAEHKTQAFHH